MKPSAPAHASHNPQALYTLYDGILPNMTHALYYKLAISLNSVVALDHKNLHTLPPDIFFFRVDGSTIPNKKSQCDKFVLGIQVTNPDAIKTTSACLMADRCGIFVKIAALDKFVHEQRIGIGGMLGSVMVNEEQVTTNFISSLTAAHTNAVARYKDEGGETDLSLKEILYILPAGTCGTNEYFNGGMSSFFTCLFFICLLTKITFLCIPLWQTAGKSRIDFNDCFELVKYPMVFSKDILDGLSAARSGRGWDCKQIHV